MDNLPLPLTSFVGRRRELEDVGAKLGPGRCVTLVGPGGVGKSRLAVEIASRVRSGTDTEVCYVDIARLGAPDAALASVLGVRDDEIASRTTAIAAAIGTRRVLVLLDTCEQVASACAILAGEIRAHCPGVTILSTSRRPIGMPGEDVVHVAPLDSSGPGSDAVLLFTERARLARPGFAVHPENEIAVTAICRRVDGLPLSIELAAACARLLTPEQTLTRLEDRFRLLRAPGRSTDERHRTLRATIDWSYELLSRDEQEMFARVAVFESGFTSAAARSVCAGGGIGEEAVKPLLDRLVQSSLAYVDLDGERYRMLDTIAAYARERLSASDGERTWRTSHRDWYLAIAELARKSIYGDSQGAWLEALEADIANLRSAIAWTIDVDGNARAALRFAAALYRFWDLHGHYADGRQSTEAAIALAAGSEPELEAEAHYGLGILAFAQGDYERTRAEVDVCLALRRELDDREGIGVALNLQSLAADYLNDFDGAVRIQEEGLAIGRELGLTAAVNQGTYHLGLLSLRMGDADRAARHLEESVAGWYASGNRIGAAGAIVNLAEVMRMRGELDRALALTDEALEIAHDTGTKRLEGACLLGRGQILSTAGEDGAALEAFRQSTAICKDLKARDWLVEIVESLSLRAARIGDETLARRLEATATVERGRLHIPRDPATQSELESALRTIESSERSPWTLEEAIEAGLGTGCGTGD